MSDDDHPPEPDTGGDAAARARLLDEQQARIAALRAAVLSGKVDEETFDYAAFFGAKPEGETPAS